MRKIIVGSTVSMDGPGHCPGAQVEGHERKEPWTVRPVLLARRLALHQPRSPDPATVFSAEAAGGEGHSC